MPHRAVGGAIDVPTLGHVAVEAVHLDVADKWGSGNLALVPKIGAFLSTAALPFYRSIPGTCTELSFHGWLESVAVPL